MLISIKCECSLAVMNYAIYISVSIFIYICCISVCYIKSFAVVNIKGSFYFFFYDIEACCDVRTCEVLVSI